MDTLSRSPEINGATPPLGLSCTAFQVLHFYENAQISDLANVTYLRLEHSWFRVYFEAASVFWRCGEAPQVPTNSDLRSGLLLNDLSGDDRVVGQVLQAIEHISQEGSTVVVLRWSGGAVLRLVYSHNLDAATF